MEYLTEKKLEYANEYQVIKLGLFGSYARDQQSEESDIDLLIEFAPETDDLLNKKARIKSEVKSRFKREVDICREKYIKPYYRIEILNSAIYV